MYSKSMCRQINQRTVIHQETVSPTQNIIFCPFHIDFQCIRWPNLSLFHKTIKGTNLDFYRSPWGNFAHCVMRSLLKLCEAILFSNSGFIYCDIHQMIDVDMSPQIAHISR